MKKYLWIIGLIAIISCAPTSPETTDTEETPSMGLENTSEAFIIEFDTNGGTSIASISVGETLPTTTRVGYDFVGWYTDKGLSKAFDDSLAVVSNITLYAKWKIASYIVSFVSNCSTKYQNETVVYNSKVTLPTPVKAGHQFVGWYDNENFTGKVLLSEIQITNDLVLYAKFVDAAVTKTYIVTFNSNGGTAFDSVTVDDGAIIALGMPAKDGFNFLGWYKDSSFTGSAIADNMTVTANTTLYAKFVAESVELKTFTVTFDSKGGSDVADSTVEDGSTITLPTTNKDGFTLEGWYTDSTCTTKFVVSTKITANTTLYAKWKAVSYTVSFESNGGGDVLSLTAEYDTTVALPTPVKAGFKFVAWHKTKELNSVFTSKSLVKCNMTLYAEWADGGLDFSESEDDNDVALDKVGDNAIDENGHYEIPCVHAGKSVTVIGEGAFKGSEKLVSVVIPDTVTTIGREAFNDCDNLESIVIPNSVITIDGAAFGGCAKLETVVIGDGVETIDNTAFAGCANLKIVTLGEKLTSIGEMAFWNTGLESIVIPDSVTTIDKYAFQGCTNLKNVTFGSGLKTIGESAFENSGLEEVVIPEGVTTIETEAFKGCANLKKVVLPFTLSTLKSNVFRDCNASLIVYSRMEEKPKIGWAVGWNNVGIEVQWGYTGK